MNDNANTPRTYETVSDGAFWMVFVAILLGGFPIATIILGHAIVTDSVGFTVLAFAGLTYGAVAGGLVLRHHPLRNHVLCGTFAGSIIAAFFLFGPTTSIGLTLAGSALVLAVFVSLRGLFVFIAVAALAFAGAAAGVIPMPPDAYNPGPIVWAREGIGGLVAIAALAMIFHGLMARLRELLDEVDNARRAELHAHAIREESLRKVAAAQRLESLGRLAGGVAHDFNNTLAVIQAGASLLEYEATDDDTREIVTDIISAARAAHETTEQLRAFARGDVDTGQPSTPGEVLQSVKSALRPLLAADIELEMTAPAASDVTVTLSNGALHQVLVNLALNARDALDGAGRIELGWTPGDDVATLWVADNGCGMDESTTAQIFEPFFTTKGEAGTGLGLAMVHGTVLRAGGTIRVESRPGEGTRIEIDFPIIDAPAPIYERADLTPHPGEYDGRILVVDDRVDLLRMMTRELERAGFEVLPIDTVSHAVDLLEHRTFDLLCTDGILPDGRATDVIEAWNRSANEGRPIIVCSGYLEEDIFEVSPAAQHHFLAKPFPSGSLSELATKLMVTAPVPVSA